MPHSRSQGTLHEIIVTAALWSVLALTLLIFVLPHSMLLALQLLLLISFSAAWFRGFKSGVIATVLGATLIWVVHPWTIGLEDSIESFIDFLSMILFIANGTLISALTTQRNPFRKRSRSEALAVHNVSRYKEPTKPAVNCEAMARSLKQIEEHYADLKGRFATNLSMPSDFGAWLYCPRGKTQYLSPSFLRIIGMTPQEASDFGWAKRIPEGEREAKIRYWHECFDKGLEWSDDITLTSLDGKTFRLFCQGGPIRDDNDDIIGWLGVKFELNADRMPDASPQ